MNLFKDFVKKYGLGIVMSAATLDGYRRQVINDRNNKVLDEINKAKENISEEQRTVYNDLVEMQNKKIKNQVVMNNYKDAADEHKKSVDKYNNEPNTYNKYEMEKARDKLTECLNDLKKLDLSELFFSLYDKYNEYLDSLTPDKIVCLFNIIISGLVLTSFTSVLSIMLSENIINKIGFLEKYPRILKLLKLRNNINKKVSKIYLLMHVILIIFGLLGNIFMFFM